MVDIWALGCILYVLCLLRHPFETSSNLAIINSKIKFPKSVSSSKQVQVNTVCRQCACSGLTLNFSSAALLSIVVAFTCSHEVCLLSVYNPTSLT